MRYLNPERIGNAIKTLRNIEGYTQQELAEYIGVTDKAVSKWERGISIPDISVVTKLAGILNTDVDNLLEGNISYLDEKWVGVLLLSELEGNISVDYRVYGKRLIDIWMSYFILANVRVVYIVGKSTDIEVAKKIYATGESLGIKVKYYSCAGGTLTEVIGKQNLMLVYDNIFLYGANLTRYFQRAMSRYNGISVLGIQHYKGKTLSYDKNKKIVQNNEYGTCARIPVMFCPGKYTKYFGTVYDVLKLKTDPKVPFYVEMCGNGLMKYEVHNLSELQNVSNYIYMTEMMTGNQIYDIKEIARIRGFIDS